MLDGLITPGSETLDVRDPGAVAARIRGSISSKQHGYEDLLAPLVAQACIDVVPPNPANFNVDNVRVVKIQGGGLHDSHVVRGMVIKRPVEGTLARVADAKVAVFAQGVDTSSTETKVGVQGCSGLGGGAGGGQVGAAGWMPARRGQRGKRWDRRRHYRE